MTIQTKDFGTVEIDPGEIIYFPQGVFSFEDTKRFILIEQDDCPAKFLQSVEEKDPRFIVFHPIDIISTYNPKVPQSSLKTLKVESTEALSFFLIAVIPHDIKNMTVNLKSPVAVNFQQRLAMQVMLENEEYGIRHRVYEEEKGEDGAC